MLFFEFLVSMDGSNFQDCISMQLFSKIIIHLACANIDRRQPVYLTDAVDKNEGRIEVLGNRRTCQGTIEGTGNKHKSVEGAKEQLVSFQGTRNTVKDGERCSFYTGKPN